MAVSLACARKTRFAIFSRFFSFSRRLQHVRSRAINVSTIRVVHCSFGSKNPAEQKHAATVWPPAQNFLVHVTRQDSLSLFFQESGHSRKIIPQRNDLILTIWISFFDLFIRVCQGNFCDTLKSELNKSFGMILFQFWNRWLVALNRFFFHRIFSRAVSCWDELL